MRIIRVFPRRTAFTPRDPLAFVGDPPLFRPEADEVHVSVTFTWDIEEGRSLQGAWGSLYNVVRIGGPAMGTGVNGFTPGLYVRPGVTFTSRGCDNACPWCLVERMEGHLQEIADFAPGNCVQDNNLLQCSRAHLERVFAMLGKQSRVEFSGGLDAQLVTPWVADEVRGLRLRQVFLAADTDLALRPLDRAVRLLGLPRWALRCYVLPGFEGEGLEEGVNRLQEVWRIGCVPFAQLYQPPDHFIHYDQEWRKVARTWSRPAAANAEGKRLMMAEATA